MPIDTSALQNTITKEVSSKIPDAAKQAANLAGGINISGLAGKAQELLKGQIGSALTSNLANLTSSFPNAASQFFGQANPLISTLSTLNSKLLGTHETNNKIQSLMSDASAAISNPVAFITKPVNDAIKGIDTMSQGSGVKDLLGNMSSLDVSNLSKSLGTAITSSSGVSNAISTISNDLAGKFSGITTSISGMVSSVVTPVTSSLNSFAGSLTAGIKSTLSTVTGTVGAVVSPIMSAGSDLTNSVLGVLPDSVRGVVSYTAQAYVATQVNNLLGSKMNTLQTIMSATSGVSTNLSEQIASSFLGLSGSSNYPTFLNASGSVNNGFGDGSTSMDDIMALYNAAMKICSGINQPSTFNYAQNKDLFDILMQLAAALGLTDLLSQLSQCTGTDLSLDGSGSKDDDSEKITYYDSRTTSILTAAASTTIVSGNSNTYNTIVNIVGAEQMQNTERDVIALNSNMEATPSNVEAFNSVLDKYGYTVEGLVVKDSIGNHKIIEGDVVGLMSATNTAVIDAAITTNSRVLTQGAMVAYAA